MSNILILGASYGSLLATKLLMAGHSVTLVCTAPTAALINRAGTRVRFPLKGRDGLVEIASAGLPGALRAATPAEVEPAGFDLAVLGMQESQYGEPAVHGLMRRIGQAHVPCLAIMNMPPLAYLHRIPALDAALLDDCYAHPDVWDAFDPRLVTLASPDPQAFRPADEPKNVLQVGLPTNFKAARFEDAAPTALLHALAGDVDAVRHTVDGAPLDIPVKLRVHESLFVPLAKWPMLLAGNYRCIGSEGMRAIQEAVHADLARSRGIYEWVADLCCRLGAQREDLVPFDKYAQAAGGLTKPSSAARALAGGATQIERVDLLVQRIAAQLGLEHPELQATVARVEAWLLRNRAAQQVDTPEAVAA
jgi:hypothetical protein